MAGTDNKQAESTDFIITAKVGENLNLTEAIRAFEDRVGLAVENGVYLSVARYPWNFRTEFENKPVSVAIALKKLEEKKLRNPLDKREKKEYKKGVLWLAGHRRKTDNENRRKKRERENRGVEISSSQKRSV